MRIQASEKEMASCGLTPTSMLVSSWLSSEGAGDTEDATQGDEARGLRDDEAEKSAAGCAEGKADAHLLRALRDGVGEDAVDADGGEDDGEQRRSRR